MYYNVALLQKLFVPLLGNYLLCCLLFPMCTIINTKSSPMQSPTDFAFYCTSITIQWAMHFITGSGCNDSCYNHWYHKKLVHDSAQYLIGPSPPIYLPRVSKIELFENSPLLTRKLANFCLSKAT